MSDIIITEQNLARFNKRLKKSFTKHFNQEISLNVASLILAETFGVDTIHNLQQKLSKKPNDELASLFTFIQDFFTKNSKTKINGFYLIKDEFGLNFRIERNQNENKEIIPIYFGHKITTLNKYMTSFSEQDVTFIMEVLQKASFNDIPQNIFLSEKIQQYLNIKEQQRAKYSFKDNDNFKEIKNYGYCHTLFSIIDENFLVKKELSTAFRTEDKFIDFSNENIKLFDNINEALNSLKNNQILLQFKTPIKQFSTLNPVSVYKMQGLSSFYIHKKDNKVVAYTMNQQISCEVGNINDYYFFVGKSMTDISSIAINHPYINAIIDGHSSNLVIKKMHNI